jgi:uncharacterized membrane protein
MRETAAFVSLATLLALAAPHPAAAEIFTCSFTEPWITLTYSTATRNVIRESVPSEGKMVAARHISLRRTGERTLSWLNARGAPIARLELTGHGSDGMSETLYPYSIRTTLIRGDGGCTTSALKARRAK